MQCGKLVVVVEKSLEETLPTEIFEHELKIMRYLYPGVRVAGRVLDAKGKRATFPLGSPEEELERLMGRYMNADIEGGAGLNVAKVSYPSPHALYEAMHAGVTDAEIRAAGEPEAPVLLEADPHVEYWSAEQWRNFMTHHGIAGWKKNWSAYQLRNKALEAVAVRGATVGVTLDDMRCDGDLIAKMADVEAAEEREAKKEAAQRTKAQAANA